MSSWSLVQSAGASAGNGTSVSATFPNPVTSGNKLIAAVSCSGGITEDSSTPAAAHGNVSFAPLTVTSNSFSPPAQSLLVAMVAIGHGSSNTPSVTLTDSGNHTWTTGPVLSGNDSWVAIYTTFLSTAPGSISVTAKDSTTIGQGMLLDVRVVNGAASNQSGAASNTNSSNSSTAWSGSITTTTVGSTVYCVAVGGNTSGTGSSNAGTTTLNTFVVTNNSDQLTGRSTNLTTTPGSTSLGWTGSAASPFAWAALEILPSISTTSVQDGIGNNWTQLGQVGNGTSQTSVWGLDVPAADAGTSVTLTAAFSTISTGSILIEEVSGLLLGSTVAMIDGTAGTLTGATQNPGSPTYSSSLVNEYLICAYGDAGNGTTVTAAGGWTLDGNSVNTNSNGNICIEYKNSTGGAETSGFSTQQASQWALVEVSFKTAALSGGVPYAGWTTFGPGLFTNPDSSYAGVQPWLGDSSITSQVAGSPSFSSGVGVFRGLKARGPGTDPAGVTGGAGVFAPAIIPTVVNQWSGSYGQGSTFATITSAFQSCVVPLTKDNSVIPGSGVPSAGNWLFAITSWTQTPSVAVAHVGTYDDIHSWWRQFPASNPSGNVRTSISYTPNLARSPSYIYVAPDTAVAAITVTVIEVSGLGPWDTIAGMSSGYKGAGTTLALTLPALPSLSFILAGVGGDSTAAGQALTPAGYTPLRPVAQANGINQSASNYLTSAYLSSSNAAQALTATSSVATDMSGFIIAVYTTGNSPIPARQNPNWPLMIFEAGFGSGFNTPDSEIVWTDISSRLWDWDETTGVQFQLGQIQSTNLIMELDNNDGFLSPSNTASPYYPNMQPGTPLRLRAALGTIGGSTVNRWYILQRNAGSWDEQIATVFRRYVPMNGTDLWASLSVTPPTFYRSEVYEDNPGWWWPMDDQPGTSQVLPTSLHNIAIGNAVALQILPSPNGVTAQQQYDTTGVISTLTTTPSPPPGLLPPSTLVFPSPLGASCAVYTVGASAGWMFGDPQSQAPTLATGNTVSAIPGSAAWQMTGGQGLLGKNGWFLLCNDNFPPIAGGITIEGWFNYAFRGSQAGYFGGPFVPGATAPTSYVWASQPIGPLTLMELATTSGPVAILQLDTSGHLNLLTYNGSTPTNHLIYAASDLRASTWFMITMTMTTTTWNVQINGGQTANVSGTGANFASAWNWLILNGDLGNAGGSPTGVGLQHGGNVQISHVAIYPAVLPYYRIMDHYWAAVTAFGLLPAPTGIQFATSLPNQQANFTQGQLSFTPDGAANGGLYGVVISTVPVFPSTTATVQTGTVYTLSAVVTANVGSYTSGPSPWAVQSGVGQLFAGGSSNPLAGGSAVGYAVYTTWNGVAASFQVYTAPAVKTELNAATVLANSETFTSGYGSSSASNRDVGVGPGQVSPGTGAPYPTTPSAIGDTVGQRIERLMRAGRVTSPKRTIDPAPLLVQAPGTNAGGVQTGSAIQSIQQSDSGLLYIDNCGNLVYWMRPHLASQYSNPVWQIGPSVTTPGSKIPYYRQVRWVTDPQRVWNSIQIVPFSPTGASLNLITPNNAAAALTSQTQYGAQPLQIQSWLQSQAEMQNQANWLLANFGTARRRVEQVYINAAAYPAAWQLVLGINVGDIVQLEDWVIGGGGAVNTFRVSSIRRHFMYGSTADSDADPVASVEIMCDYEPTSYWT